MISFILIAAEIAASISSADEPSIMHERNSVIDKPESIALQIALKTIL